MNGLSTQSAEMVSSVAVKLDKVLNVSHFNVHVDDALDKFAAKAIDRFSSRVDGELCCAGAASGLAASAALYGCCCSHPGLDHGMGGALDLK